MNAITRRICCLGFAALLAGCISPQYTKLPTLRPQPQDFTYHNPLPDREAGAAIDLPRGFDRQRSEPTRTLQRAEITNEIVKQNGGGSTTNPSASKYPGSVNE
ncbi:MAG TPA: hypothetical protein VGH74_14900 [Planctomycetaceae bacterium]|jgi:hypothetical protein